MSYLDLSWTSARPAEGFYLTEVQTPKRLPVRTFLPTGFQPNYAYPLLVLFHGHGSSEEQVLRLAPRVSRRNYIAIALRGPHALENRLDGRVGYSWRQDGRCDALLEDYVFQAVEQTCSNYRIHSERIYLAGICEGSTPAYRLGLQFPGSFAGVAALNGALPRDGGPLFHLPEARQLRVFIGHGLANAVVPLATARRDLQLLYTAGLSVKLHTYAANHRLHPDMLRDVNRWVMQGIPEAVW